MNLSDFGAPVYGFHAIGEADTDLTRHHAGEPLGERIIVSGQVTDEDGRPVTDTLVEIWQCNAGGPLHPCGGRSPGAARPQFHRGRAGGHRRRKAGTAS